MRVRYLVAAVVALMYFGVAAPRLGSFPQFAVLALGILLVGGILWPDDFKAHPPSD